MISQTIINWYFNNKRDLPWRDTIDPYKVWISEIILQQTRVNQGINYYYRFIESFPDIFSLANAEIDHVLKLWQGLGYYSRARNMHETAKYIVNYYNGVFPTEYTDLVKLKGIGEYTAAAIASFCFNAGIPVIDGNVFRVLSRIFGITESTQSASGKKIFKEKAHEIIDKKQAHIFNQAIMEFGALQCIPKNPDCTVCPLKEYCFAFNNQMVIDLPAKKIKVNQSNRFFSYIYIIYKNTTFIEKRTADDIWKMLYQIPLIETQEVVGIHKLSETELWNKLFDKTEITLNSPTLHKTHILSHQKLNCTFYKIQINKPGDYIRNHYIQIPVKEINKYSIPRVLDWYFGKINQ